MKRINLTPHAINIVAEDGTEIVTLPPSGSVARVDVKPVLRFTSNGIAHYAQVIGGIIGLPGPEEDTQYIVSAQVRLALPGRMDIASPGELKRNDAGQPVGCVGLYIN